MKTVLIILVVLIIVSILLLYVLGLMSRSGNAPGLVGGQLLQCPGKPNCVCSEYHDDPQHYIDPVILPKNFSPESLDQVKDIIREMGGQLETENEAYLAAVFSSKIFGFVDDFEIRVDRKNSIIQLRSASRVGRGDLGVNKKRTEEFKKRLQEKIQP